MTALKRPELLPILVCPESHQALVEAGRATLEWLNDQVRQGRCRNRSGETVRETLAAALARADGKILYPIRHGVPLLLVGEGLPVG